MVKRYSHTAIVTIQSCQLAKGEWVAGKPTEIEVTGQYYPSNSGQQLKRNVDGREFDTLYNKLSYDTRDIVRSSRFKEIFPDVQLRGDKQNVHGWSLDAARQVSYFGAGVGGTVIGFGASMLAMTDDLYKSLEDALSDTNNEKV